MDNTIIGGIKVKGDGRVELQSKFAEEGTTGLEAFGGFIREAYESELYWPQVEPLYSRIWRSDPEATIVRLLFEALSNDVEIGWILPDRFSMDEVVEPTDDDKRALDFAQTVNDDIDGGINKWFTSSIVRVPFFGWGWWEVLPGMRIEGWRPPQGDPWRSSFDDNLIGYRRFAFRRYSSFYAWDMDDDTGRLLGMEQLDSPNPPVTLPLERSLHLTFGDHDNPEGLATLEAMWRLERIKYNLEMIQGMGFEHSAGYLNVETEGSTLTAADLQHIRKAARAIMSAQEGNYAAWPKGMSGELRDVSFSAASSMMEAIRYYGILKLALLGMQYVAMSSISEHGSYSSISDASDLALAIFNAIATGIVNQADEQVGKRLFEYPINKEAFPDMTRRPKLDIVKPARKRVELDKLSSIMTALNAIMPLGDEDIIAIRRETQFMPEQLPDISIEEEPEDEFPDGTEESPSDDDAEDVSEQGEDEQGSEEEEPANLARRPFVVDDDEQPTGIQHIALYDEKDVRRAVNKFEKWAEENEPDLARLLRATIYEGEEE